MREHHVQQVEVEAESGEMAVLSVWDSPPFFETDDDLDECYEPEWWRRKYTEALGREYAPEPNRRSFRLDCVLEVYDHHGWEHYDTATTGKQDPESVVREDDVRITLALFFRKRESAPGK